jgi:tetratricopeptide (TPR) repeat protein
LEVKRSVPFAAGLGILFAAWTLGSGCQDGPGNRAPLPDPSPETLQWIADAHQAEAEDRVDDALGLYQRVLVAQPHLVEVRVRVAEIARRRGNREEAVRHASQAVAAAPHDVEARIVLARSLAPDKPAQAERVLAPLRDASPPGPIYRIALGEVAVASGDATAAMADFRSATAATEDPLVLLDAARGMSRAGFAPEGLALVDRVLAAGPTPDARYTRAWILEYAERYQESVEEYASILQDHPSYVPAYRNLGALMARDGEVPRAIRLWEQGLGFAPDDAGLKANVVEALKALGLELQEAEG